PGVPPGAAMLSQVAIDPQGRFLIVAERDGGFPRFTDWVSSALIDPATGALDTAWSKAQVPFEVGALALHPGGRCGLVAPRSHAPRVAAFTISKGADLAPGVMIGARDGVLDLAVDPSGRVLLVLDTAGVLAFEITNPESCALGPPHGPEPVEG